MKRGIAKTAILFVLAGFASVAIGAENQRDEKAINTINQMIAYTSALDKVIITADVSTDAGLDAGLIVSNPAELTIKFDRPGSMHMKRFDGINTTEIVIHEGNLTVYNSENGFFARADVPEDIEEAMQFAMEKYDVDTPLSELFFSDATQALMAEQDTVLYLTDKSRVRGTDCHHLAIRGDEIDLQLWVTEGANPVPKEIMMTMKWVGGSPRSTAVLDWETVSEFEPGTFEFSAPEGAQEIPFANNE